MEKDYYKNFEPINGKWYIVNTLGSGSYGTVFEVEREDFNTTHSAMKIITIPPSENEVESYRRENYDLDEKSITSYFYGFVEDVIKEFEIMSLLKGHSNIVSYEDHDVIEHKDGVGWDIFIRMELLTPMNEYFKENHVTKEKVIQLGIDLCKALEVCEMHGVIHRDIKPSNIFISKTGDFKLGDFGVARTLEKTSSGMSQKGTFTYMAPEVSKNEPYGKTVDLYSLGIVLYRLMNNNMEPFRKERTHADSTLALEKRMMGEPVPPPANADEDLAKIILKACAYKPDDRYSSPALMRQDLESLLKDDVEAPLTVMDEADFCEDLSATKSMFDTTTSEQTVSIFGEEVTQHEMGEVADGKTSSTNSKKRLYIAIAAIAVIMIAFFVARSFRQADNLIEVSSIAGVPAEITMLVGDEYVLEPEVLPADASDKDIRYVAADETIVKVSDDGGVVALSEGTTNVTVQCDGISRIVAVEVVAYIDGQELENLFKAAQEKLDTVLNDKKIDQANVTLETNLMKSTLAVDDIESISEESPSTLVILQGEYNDFVLPALEKLNTAYETAKSLGKTGGGSTGGSIGKTLPNTESTRCPDCGSTAHTVHPRCPDCGSAYHTTHSEDKPVIIP